MKSYAWRWFTVVLLLLAAAQSWHCDDDPEGADEPECKVEPEFLDFDTLQVGTSDIRDIIITNVGGGTLARTVSDTCEMFSIVGGPSSYDLQNGESHTITVQFQPTAVGAFACTLDVGMPLCILVPCSGVSTPIVQ